MVIADPVTSRTLQPWGLPTATASERTPPVGHGPHRPYVSRRQFAGRAWSRGADDDEVAELREQRRAGVRRVLR